MIGTVLDGRYRLEELVSRGGLGDVWRCVDEDVDRTVAAKLLAVSPQDDSGIVGRLRLGWTREMATIDHHGVVHVYASGVDPDAGVYVIMEYVEGESLSSILAREGRLTPARTMQVVARTAEALEAVHGCGFLHRDLRPARVLVRRDATVVLSAFGLGYLMLQPDGMTVALGNAGYVPPEQLKGEWATVQSDIFSLGVIAYQCLAGRRPFEGDSPLEVALSVVRDPAPPLPPDVPAQISSIVERAMAKDPASRWPSAAAFATAALAAG